MTDHLTLATLFSRNGIQTTSPGFYDHPRFLELEGRDPNFLEQYARFVCVQPYEKPYLERARREIPIIAEAIRNELVADGRLGACVDIGMMLSRILEQEGYWNYMAKGSLTIRFQPSTGIQTKYFWSFDLILNGQKPFAAGHAWIVAPPFAIVDISVKQQPYREGRDLLPSSVIAEHLERASPAIEDVFSPDYCAFAKAKHGIERSRIIETDTPHLPAFQRLFPPGHIEIDGVKLKYTPVGVGAPDRPLERMNIWRVGGRLPTELYADIVKPKLEHLREHAKDGPSDRHGAT